AGHKAPYALAGLRLHSVNRTITGAADQQPETVDGRNRREGVGRVVRPSAWSGHPHDVSSPLVERDEPMRAITLGTPARDGCADDHQVAVDERRHRSSSVRGEGGKLLADRTLPQQFSIFVQG